MTLSDTEIGTLCVFGSVTLIVIEVKEGGGRGVVGIFPLSVGMGLR